MSVELRRTPLYECHQRAGARFTGFSGWEMPIQYSGLSDEHITVRNAAGLFDVSHMGEVIVEGERALDYLQYVTSNDVSKLTPGRAQYSLLLNESGGVVDDIIVYQLAAQHYLLCVNAGNTEKDVAWLTKQNESFRADVREVSAEFAQVALQGPKAQDVLSRALELSNNELSKDSCPFFSVRVLMSNVCGLESSQLIIARTGYTGEDGFEVFCRPEDAHLLWDAIIEAGKDDGVKPAGLGARDTLRLEAAYPLHGHEINDDLSALVSGLNWVVKVDKGEFIGREAILKEKKEGSAERLVGLEVLGAGIVREGASLHATGGETIGRVTSGTKTPTVGKAIAMAVVREEFSVRGALVTADVRGREVAVTVVKLPFYKRGVQ